MVKKNYICGGSYITMEKLSFSEKHPVIQSLIVTLLFLLAVSVGGAVSSMAGVDSKITLFIAYLIVAVVLIVLVQKKKNWNYFGFRAFEFKEKKNVLIYIPLYLIALLPLIAGFEAGLSVGDVLYVVFFMAIVAFVEETVFRGFVLKLLQKKSVWFAIIGSSLLFSIPHILNALSGKEIGQTIFQITYALVIGVILAMLLIKTGNIIPLILYHFLNNTFSSLSSTTISDSFSLAISIAVFSIGFVYMIFLYVSIRSSLT